jgi:hypothetical protein
MLINILTHTPLWVWALLLALLALGLVQSRARQVRRGQLLMLPVVLLLLSLWSMAPGFVRQPWVAVVWLLAFAGMVAAGRNMRVADGTRWLTAEQRLQVAGSWWPMALILSIFSLRYASGVGHALHPEWLGMLQVQVPLALTFGALSGLFLGRALGLWKLTRPAHPALGAAPVAR